MTDHERDTLLLGLQAAVARLEEGLQRVETDHGARLGRIESNHRDRFQYIEGILGDHTNRLQRIEDRANEQAARLIGTDERVTAIERGNPGLYVTSRRDESPKE